jgi:hypothetical protein
LRKLINLLIALFVIAAIGCQQGTPGSGGGTSTRDQAKDHLSSEIEKWMGGRESDAVSVDLIVDRLERPISYEIKSILDEAPDPLAMKTGGTLSPIWKSWPAYRLNVALEFQSASGKSVERIVVYTMTFNPDEGKWYVRSSG